MKNKLFILYLISFFLLSCASYQLVKNLDPASKEFYSNVRYVITKQERKIFLNLPASERENFIVEFWNKRDPDPDTEENEFKIDYFNRIEEANVLFKQGSTPGWLQDRGRVYITLGPPTNRETYPRGTHQYGIPTEIWYYGFFPVLFIDVNWTGNYKLDAISAQHFNEINRAQSEFGPKIPRQKIVFDFDFKVKEKKKGEALFQIIIPYNNIWFAEEKNLLQTTFGISMEVFDENEARVWQYQKDHELSLPGEELVKFIGKNYFIELNVKFKPGNYTLTVEIENKTGGERVSKNVKLEL